MLIGHLALITSAVFAGAAVYISIAEHPARLTLDDRALLEQWKLSYRRGFMMQASLAILGSVLGVAAYILYHDARWLVGAILLFANWPFTLIFIMPTNNALMATSADAAGAESRRLLERWGGLHAFRGVLGVMATLMFFWALN